MTEADQKILLALERIERKIKVRTETPVEWLTAGQIESEFGLSKKYLQLKRRQGIIKNFRCLTSGKNFQYRRDEIEKLFVTIKN